MRYDAVLFDLDGTLIEDTTAHYVDALAAGLQHIGMDAPREKIDQMMNMLGMPRALIFQSFELTPEAVITVMEVRHKTLVTLMREGNIWRSGAPELLKAIEQHPRAIITGGSNSHVKAIDEALGLRSRIPIIISKADVGERKKPDPYGLLLASEKLVVDPAKCVYVGDQRNDIEAATSAGMEAILIQSKFTRADLKHSPTITLLSELSKHLS